MVNEITFQEARHIKDAVIIDVRSEGEFEESHIPGAFNVPIFDNEERANVGTVYKQTGKEQAKELGLRIASAKLPDLVGDVRNVAQGNPVVVYCWRGGMRSTSISTILDLMGMETYRLERGYRGYREYVTDAMANYSIPGRCILIHGMTGTGKTELLKLLSEDSEPVIDLEALASHKGSAFGAIGEEPRNQRMFDSLLLDELNKIKDRPYFFMEAESQRIGRVRMPEFLWEKRVDGVHVLVEASVQTRVQRLLCQYVIEDPDLGYKFSEAFRHIESKLTPDDRKYGWAALQERRFADFAEMLLVRYYDPRYSHTLDNYMGQVTVLSSEDLADCKEQMKRIARENTAEVAPSSTLLETQSIY